MALTEDQYARLLGKIKLETRSKLAGQGKPTKNEKQLMRAIDASNSQHFQQTTQVIKSVADRLQWPGLPEKFEDSGLTAEGFNFDDSQQLALKKLIHGRHVCLIGAAGTGKTTMVRHAMASLIYGGEGIDPIGIRALSDTQGPSIAICAFTGIATHVIRQTLPNWLHPACKTIHGLLEYKPLDAAGKADTEQRGMFVPTRNSKNKLDHDLIVIDEASMLGLDLWHNLVDALRPHTRIILIGDLNQLKPVGDATMFAYALSAGLDKKEGWDIAELTTIHRQSEPAANKIIDAAHAILNGKNPKFDNAQDPDWRVIGYELPSNGNQAHKAIIAAVDFLRQAETPGDPERALFDPYQDLLMTAGNGFDENDTASFVQQAPLNDTLSRLIEPPTDEHPIYVIDAGRDTKRFAVGHRVMATKNESPAVKDRVTNGMTGRIVKIEPNINWRGKQGMFGTEAEVMAWRSRLAKEALSQGTRTNALGVDFEAFRNGLTDTSHLKVKEVPEERQASHVLTIEYGSGTTRTYRSAAEVGSIRLAYAVTVHKAQGSQADTVIIICHHAVKRQLSREWFYTAITRAKRRAIILYTRMGMSVSVNRQQIFGANLREKVNRYRQTMETGRTIVRLQAVMTIVEQDAAE